MENQPKIVIEPFYEDQLNPNSYNLRLGSKLLRYVSSKPGSPFHDMPCLDMKTPNPVEEIIIPPDGLWLSPGELYLGNTVEYTETHNLVPVIEGRSSAARLGLSVHITAGFGDIGFCGHWTLEITVVHPLRVYPDVEICQIAYTDVLGAIVPYKGKYQAQEGKPIPSAFYKDFIKPRQRYQGGTYDAPGQPQTP